MKNENKHIETTDLIDDFEWEKEQESIEKEIEEIERKQEKLLGKKECVKK